MRDTMTKTDHFFFIFGWILFVSLFLLSIFQTLTGRTLTDFPIPCSFRAVTGYFCPGCGGTHAVCSLARGQLLRCAREHAFVAYTATGFFLYNFWNSLALLSRHVPVIPGIQHRKNPGHNTFRAFPVIHFHTWYVYPGIAIIFLQCIAKNMALIFHQ